MSTIGNSMEFIEHIPYLLPSLAIALLALILAFVIFNSFDETLIKRDITDIAPNSTKIRDLLKDRSLVVLLATYALYSFTSTATLELIPLWCWAERSAGGLSYSHTEIGGLILLVSLFTSICNQMIYRKISKRIGYRRTYLLGTLCGIPSLLMIPFLTDLVQYEEISTYVLVLVFYSLVLVSDFLSKTTIYVMLGNLTLPNNRSKAFSLM
jgi:hypothetical protein